MVCEKWVIQFSMWDGLYLNWQESDNYVRNTDMTSCGRDATESDGRTRCHYFSLWERTLPRDNASCATVTAKHKTTTAGNSSIIVSSDRRQIP